MPDRPTIIVTGCSSGIGAYCARALQRDGWRVFATVRRPEDQAPLEAEGIETFIMDYTRPETIAALVEAVMALSGGRIDALFNNGAYGQAGAVEDLPTEALRLQLETNVIGWHDLTRRVIPAMRARGHGRIVQCSSILGLVPYRWRGAYNASKFALEALSLTLRMELAGSGIGVSLIEPGPIASKFTTNAIAYIERFIDLENSVHRAEYERQMRRLRGESKPAPGKLGPDAVYAALKHALTARRPRPHYIVTRPARQGALLKKLLPAALFYRIIGRLG
ncbi:SDR family oxidoreductase [Sinorhizobium meliloti WSM1022]|jgi:NAD(P)-dependent dehydrogenase (short-subunit alcohol dehydrogenase family)|uniref:Short chain dehydrogenase n=5 Tax=Sinorhizobium TaxID=28105 RepID=H0G6C7_RHIML|nr:MULTISPECIES: SDR family oxidoreductase [Sinorhizobium]PST23916.1 short-chain dehydrogenase [Mesorhizobium loti]TWA89007.1 NADP-dependent 3-hydroxy acid dehydrogenase YdfG [Ensifer sp. SEMIA 134]TWB24921.1 NADP-dependent 3-hydroxy acid dehydrogenase YdfG [Ensifer sp. SEMIA 135]AEG05367.1 short-chain dehydrogenase/reductase SDR [Sinorhizobium meliloti BL225C]AEG54401.1 short-chain dehydrogenase/reductase SDR [Sinorhizobium meliloti AK83]